MLASPPSITAQDSYATAGAIGLVAYISADVSHHVVGHGGACLGAGGQLEVLSSVFARCSCKNAYIDLAGPLANLLLGLVALGAARVGPVRVASLRLFLVLTAGFNLLYFAGQLLFDAATKTDDWAWPLLYFQVSALLRYGLVAFGGAAYWLTMRVLGRQLAPFAWPRSRATALMYCAWAAAGLVACATAALDYPAGEAILYRAIPQSLLLPLGLLFVPAGAARWARPNGVAARLAFSWPWVAGAALAGAATVLILGPGFATTR